MGADRPGGGIDGNGLTMIASAFVPVDFFECGGGDIADQEALNSCGLVLYGIEVDVVGAEASITRQESRFGKQGLFIILVSVKREAEVAHGL